MSTPDAPPPEGGVGAGMPDDGASRALGQPRQDIAPEAWRILKRGHQRMVLFRDAPSREIVETLHRLRIVIGVVATGDRALPTHMLTACGYAFVSARSRSELAFADALRDLTRANWIPDQDAALPVIIGQGALIGIADPKQLQKVEA